MLARNVVLLTPSISLRLVQPHSCAQITRETPPIPFFVFKRLRTLSFSVSCKSCICHSYENCRVCTNNSQSGTLRCKLAKRHSTDFCGAPCRFFLSAYSLISALLADSASPDRVGILITFPSLDFQLLTVNFQPRNPLSPFLATLPSPLGGGRQDTRGKCWPKAHPISRYNWRYGCAFDCFGHRRHTAG